MAVDDGKRAGEEGVEENEEEAEEDVEGIEEEEVRGRDNESPESKAFGLGLSFLKWAIIACIFISL